MPLSTDDQNKIDRIRAELPAVQRYVYFNTGTCGPLPHRSHAALADYARLELEEGRIMMDAWTRLLGERQATREAVAKFLGCAPEEVALTHSTTEGMNIALMGLDWKPGDEVVTAVTEHHGGLNPLYLLKQRYGIKIRQTAIGRNGVDTLAELERVIGPKTKAVVLSHVSWSSGMVLPVAEISALAHRHGALFICDGAQGAGMVPVPVYELGVDAYALSGQKWLLGPDGTGALFVSRQRQSDIWQTFMGYEGVATSDFDGYYVPPASALRYEAVTLYTPAVRAFRTSLEWITGEIGWPWVYARISALGQYCYDGLQKVERVTIHSPREALAGLIHFKLEGVTADTLVNHLSEQGILVRSIPDVELVRVSTGFYNTEQEIDRLIEAIKGLPRS